jgi:hypothetical protein
LFDETHGVICNGGQVTGVITPRTNPIMNRWFVISR